MIELVDQIGNTMRLGTTPRRIVSLVPSQTELLYSLGLEEATVGITKFCVHPLQWFRTKERVGGTKQADIEKIKSLRPDLILANKEENVKEQVEALMNFCPVYTSDVNNLQGAMEMIAQLGLLTGREEKAAGIINTIRQGFASLQPLAQPLRTCYLIWRNPYMTIGGDTFIHDMLNRCGFQNIYQHSLRYPVVDTAALAASGCELVLLSSEPYPFGEKHIEEIRKILPFAKIVLVDGEMFSWYGSRLLQAPQYFASCIDRFK